MSTPDDNDTKRLSGADALNAELQRVVSFDTRTETDQADGDVRHEYCPKAPKARTNQTSPRLTDTGNAERLADLARGQILFATSKVWLAWDGKRWVRDAAEVNALRWAKKVTEGILREAKMIKSHKRRDRLERHCSRSESAARQTAMLRLVVREPGMSVGMEVFDRNHMLLNVENGTIDLENGTLYEHNAQDWITKLAHVEYDADALCPRWEQFLKEIFLDNTEVIEFVQRAVGLSLTGNVSEEVLLILCGSGANGKTTFLEVVAEVLGDYAHTVSPEVVLARCGSDNNLQAANRAELFGRRLVYMQETEKRRQLSVATVKALTGSDRITACRKYENPVTFEPTHKIWLSTNHRPEVDEVAHAIWRRICLVPFEKTFTEESRDNHLREKLRAESKGILAWAVRGCAEWQRIGLAAPESVQRATATYRAEQDIVGRFFEGCCRFDRAVWSETPRLRVALERFCQAEGVEAPDFADLLQRLRERGCTARGQRVGRRSNVRGWAGVAVQVPGEEMLLNDEPDSANGANAANGDSESFCCQTPFGETPGNGRRSVGVLAGRLRA